MTFLIILVTLYLIMIGYLGYRGWKGTKTAADYLIAGGDTHPVVMALSYGATFISTSAIIGFGGAAAIFGMGLQWLTFLNIFTGILIAFIFFGSRTRAIGHHLQAHTFPELIGKRFQSKGLQSFAGIIILLFMPIYTGAVLMGATYIISARLGISYEVGLFFFSIIVALYVIMGGLKGVMYSDAMQGGLIFLGLLLLLGITYYKLGGITIAHERLTNLAPLAIAKWGKAGQQGWTAMPRFGSAFWWIMISQITLGVGLGVLVQPQLTVRFMTVKSTRELNRAVFIGAIFILVTVGVSYIVGPLSNVFFMEVPPKGAETAIGKLSIMAANGKIGQIIPLYMDKFMPSWLADIFFVTLLAAAMSTVSSQFHAMGTAASRDLYEVISSTKNEKGSIVSTRIGIILTFIWSVFLAETLPHMFSGKGEAIIARGTAVFFGLCASSFLPLFIGGLYTKAITKAGALWGCAIGFCVSAFWLIFVKNKEATTFEICKFLTGKNSLAADIQNLSFIPNWIIVGEVDPTVVALPIAILLTIVISISSRKFSKDHLDNCFAAIKK